MTVLDTAYRCPACRTPLVNTPRDGGRCPNCNRTIEEAIKISKEKSEPEAKKPEPDWLTRQNRLAPLVVQHDEIAERLTRAQSVFRRRKHQDPSPPILDKLYELIQRLSDEKARHWLRLIDAGLKYGELPKLQALIAEGRLPRIS